MRKNFDWLVVSFGSRNTKGSTKILVQNLVEEPVGGAKVGGNFESQTLTLKFGVNQGNHP